MLRIENDHPSYVSYDELIRKFDSWMANWNELESAIAQIRKRPLSPARKRDSIWRSIENNPITPKSIDQLISEGWKLTTVPLSYSKAFCLPPPDKKIVISTDLEGYQRDKALSHEVCHACYLYELDDSLRARNLGMFFGFLFGQENQIITEWLGRQLRADPKLLRHVVLAFGLEPQIYDKSSFEAFHPFDSNKESSSQLSDDDFERLKKVMMD